MEEASLPQIMLYGWEEKICTWTKQMLERLGLNLVDSWQELCKDRDSWYQQYQEGLLKLSQVGKSLSVANQQPHCWCEGIFKRTGNYARYQKYCNSTQPELGFMHHACMRARAHVCVCVTCYTT